MFCSNRVPFQYRQDPARGVARARDPRHRGRGHRLLARPRHLRAVPPRCGAALGRGEAFVICQASPGNMFVLPE